MHLSGSGSFPRYTLLFSLCVLLIATVGWSAIPDDGYTGEKPLDPVNGKIGIFDLQEIHSVPLDPQIVSKREEDGVITEEIFFTGRPGVRIYMVMTYLKGATKRPVILGALNAGTATPRQEAKNGFVGISVCPPCNNRNANAKLTVGGPPFNQFFTDDPEQSWYYHYVVALTRAFDYLATRSEADMSMITVTGFSTAGYVVNLLHAIESRPRCYLTYHGSGYYTEPDGTSGGKQAYLTRKQYEMYGPAAYAKYGSSPLYICSALDDYFAMFDGLMEIYTNLRCPKRLAVSPNRGHLQTSRQEFRFAWNWIAYWLFDGKQLPKVADGTVTVRDGQLIYAFSIDSAQAPTLAEVMYSYGKPGNWAGRTWHRRAATKVGPGQYELNIPIYDPAVPLYVLAQIETPSLAVIANTPQFVDVSTLGIEKPNALYPRMLHSFEEKSDLYIPVGAPRFVEGRAPEGNTFAAITPFDDNTVHFVNIEPVFWKGAKELKFYLKGYGTPGAIDLFLAADRNYWDYPSINIIPANAALPATWQQYTVSLEGIGLDDVTTLVFRMPNRKELAIDAIRVE